MAEIDLTKRLEHAIRIGWWCSISVEECKTVLAERAELARLRAENERKDAALRDAADAFEALANRHSSLTAIRMAGEMRAALSTSPTPAQETSNDR